MYKVVVCTLCCLFAGTVALVGKKCTNNNQCAPGECCQILNTFMVVSKRLVRARKPTNGTCQKYRLEGDNCDSFEKINGYCSCEPGTVCHTYEVPWGNTVQARLIAAPRFGYNWVSQCEKTSP